MVWPLTWTVIIGTLPGVFIGAWVRIAYLPDPKDFKIFAGAVLLYIGRWLLRDVITGGRGGAALARRGHGSEAQACVTGARFSLSCVQYTFAGVLFYQFLDLYLKTGVPVAPDWFLGALFGIGGFLGVYPGARCQKYVPVRMPLRAAPPCGSFEFIEVHFGRQGHRIVLTD
ncbi:MAG: hypothetical protein AB9866_24420 [Syntrophobacteraceae bacterium]